MNERQELRRFINKQELNELFVNLSDTETDADLLRLAIVAEYDATSLYERMAEKAANPRVKKVLLDVAQEERIHVGEFKSLLKQIEPKQREADIEGEKEVEDLA